MWSLTLTTSLHASRQRILARASTYSSGSAGGQSPARWVRQYSVGGGFLHLLGLRRREPCLEFEADRTLQKDRGVEHGGREVGALGGRVAAVVLPEPVLSTLTDDRGPCRPHRGQGGVLLVGDEKIPVVESRLHGGVVGQPVDRRSVAVRPSHEEHRLGSIVSNRGDEVASPWIQERLAKRLDGGYLALLLQDDDVPLAGGDHPVGV